MTDGELISTEHAARLLNVHVNTVLRWIKEGRLPTSKIGREYRIPRRVLENRVKQAAPGTRIIAVANQKGGVAKTTTTLNLAASISQSRHRLLVVDLDPQGGCAVSLGIATDSLNKAVYNVLMGDDVRLQDVIIKTRHGFHLAPSNIDLAGAEVELKQLLAAEQVLKRTIEGVLDEYDYVLLDCPPSLGMLTINALTCARELRILGYYQVFFKHSVRRNCRYSCAPFHWIDTGIIASVSNWRQDPGASSSAFIET